MAPHNVTAPRLETISVTSKELAAILGVSYETVRKWGANAPVPRRELGNKRYYFRKDDLAKYLGVRLHAMFPETEGLLEECL